MPSSVVIYVLASILAAVLGLWLGKRLFTADQELEARRKTAAQMATVCSNFGLTVIPKMLVDYSVGDYSDLLKTFVQFCETTLQDQTHLLNELNSVFSAVLDKQLATPAGLALVQAKIAALTAPAAPATAA